MYTNGGQAEIKKLKVVLVDHRHDQPVVVATSRLV